mmetsp:Transcript_150991/g.263864  ORF Transcript_150991/g.263864 Transcript_150991/m.263864 type:complete len:214 (-) Transcript_150991:40-681(-)
MAKACVQGPTSLDHIRNRIRCLSCQLPWNNLRLPPFTTLLDELMPPQAPLEQTNIDPSETTATRYTLNVPRQESGPCLACPARADSTTLWRQLSPNVYQPGRTVSDSCLEKGSTNRIGPSKWLQVVSALTPKASHQQVRSQIHLPRAPEPVLLDRPQNLLLDVSSPAPSSIPSPLGYHRHLLGLPLYKDTCNQSCCLSVGLLQAGECPEHVCS